MGGGGLHDWNNSTVHIIIYVMRILTLSRALHAMEARLLMSEAMPISSKLVT